MKFSLDRVTSLFSSMKPQLKVGILLTLGLIFIFLSTFGGKEVTEAKGEEERLTEICSMIEGVGDCRVMMTYRGEGDERTVYAVLIVCEGGESVFVRERITDVLCSLYGIGANRVEIQRLYSWE